MLKVFKYLENQKTYGETVLNTKCEFHFLQLLFEIFFAALNI
jgi:hypothetical protein